MDRFSSSSPVTLVFDMIDDEGESITATSISYSLFDEEGDVLIDDENLQFTSGSDEASVTISANDNALPEGSSTGARTVRLKILTSTHTVKMDKTYILEGDGLLSVPYESSMTITGAYVVAAGFSSSVLDSWNEAEEFEKKASLVEAWPRVSRFPFKPWRRSSDIPSEMSKYACEPLFIGEITKDEWDLLPVDFKKSLKRAHIIEAATALGGDSAWDRRASGIVQKTVGESSETYNKAKPASSSISPRSKREISKFIFSRIVASR